MIALTRKKIKMSKYKDMSQEDFDRILMDILREHTGEMLLDIPNIYEAVSEYFNNEILQRWEDEKF